MTSVFPAASIDQDALRHNLQCVRKSAPSSKIMAVVKAGAYGHGLALTVPALADADALAVARVAEGVAIRARGFQRQLVVLEGATDVAELAQAARSRLELVVHQDKQLQMLQDFRTDSKLAVWLKINTGMNRLGWSVTDAANVLAQLQKLSAVARPVRLMSHLACADEAEDAMTREQIASFRDLSQAHDGACSLANSAGLLGWPEARLDWVRPGIMLYGISPFSAQTGTGLGLKPVMHFYSELIAIHRISAGESVGYGATWTAQCDTSIGIVAAGYGDGYPGNLASGAPVLINGHRYPVAGRVSMDMLAVDLGSAPTVAVGDQATLWGTELPVEEIAALSGRISYELVCGVSKRVPRVAA